VEIADFGVSKLLGATTTKLTPEVRRKLSFEYRSKATLYGWPLVHVATGVDLATGRKRTASGIIALGSAPRGIIAFSDVAVGVVACGIFGYGVAHGPPPRRGMLVSNHDHYHRPQTLRP